MKISTYHKRLGDNVYFVKGINLNVGYRYWDRIYITTLFTYNWKVSVDTILHYKRVVGGDLSRIKVGGIMASLEPKALWEETGIIPTIGVLSKPFSLDTDNDLIVDEMLPDYQLFDASEISPPTNYTLVGDSYFGYTTRGCVNKCDFCGVHRLEPQFIEYTGIKPYIKAVIDKFGEKAHLILFDNNILASKKFEQIINDIIEVGFYKTARFGPTRKLRRLDFNQGTDMRLMTENHVKLLSQTSISPLRIAFDNIKYKNLYCEKIKLAAKYGITNLSNYILYNHRDNPEDFWERLRINIELNRDLGVKIYSFPMKYIPLDAKDRTYISEPNWNWFFVRNVQRVLNVMKGSVMTGEDFFYRAFGQNKEEFLEILHMPEKIIMYRSHAPQAEEISWRNKFRLLTATERKLLINILANSRTNVSLQRAYTNTQSSSIKQILAYYIVERKQVSLFDVSVRGNNEI